MRHPDERPRASAAGHDGDLAAPARSSIALRAVIWYQRTFTGGAPTCRFYPSCSSYAREALEVHGTRRGLWLTGRRLLRCRPFGPSGVDLVPPPPVGSVSSDDPVEHLDDPVDHVDAHGVDHVDAHGVVETDVIESGRDRPQPSRKAS